MLWPLPPPLLLARKCVFHWAPSVFFLYLCLLLSLSSPPSFGVTLAGYNEMSDVRMHSLSFSIFQSCGLTPRRCLKHTETLSAVPPSLLPFPPKLSFCSQLLSHPFRSQIASPDSIPRVSDHQPQIVARGIICHSSLCVSFLSLSSVSYSRSTDTRLRLRNPSSPQRTLYDLCVGASLRAQL